MVEAQRQRRHPGQQHGGRIGGGAIDQRPGAAFEPAVDEAIFDALQRCPRRAGFVAPAAPDKSEQRVAFAAGQRRVRGAARVTPWPRRRLADVGGEQCAAARDGSKRVEPFAGAATRIDGEAEQRGSGGGEQREQQDGDEQFDKGEAGVAGPP